VGGRHDPVPDVKRNLYVFLSHKLGLLIHNVLHKLMVGTRSQSKKTPPAAAVGSQSVLSPDRPPRPASLIANLRARAHQQQERNFLHQEPFAAATTKNSQTQTTLLVVALLRATSLPVLLLNP